MKHHILTAVILSLLFLGACNTVSLVSDYDKSVDFTKFRTVSYYGWADNSAKLRSPFDKERIEKAFGAEFAKRNLTYVDKGGDLTVALFIHTEDRQQTTATTTGMGGYGGYWGYGPGWGWGPSVSTTTVNTYNYKVGTLVCDVFDAGAEKLIWESSASGEIDDNPNTREERISKVVAQIMERYPVPAAKK